MHCVVAAIFVYNALFEMKPRPATTRVEGLLHISAFVLGASCALVVELIEDMTTSEGSAEHLINQTKSYVGSARVLSLKDMGR